VKLKRSRLGVVTEAAERMDDEQVDGEAAGMLGLLEELQDRLDALQSILDMQVERVQSAGFAVDLENPVVNWENLLYDVEKDLARWEGSLSLGMVEDFERRREDFNTVLAMSQKRRPDRDMQKRLASVTSLWNSIEEQLRDMVAIKREQELAKALETKRYLDETLLWMETGTHESPGDWLDEIQKRTSSLLERITEDPVLKKLEAFKSEKLTEYGIALDHLIHSVENELLVDRPLQGEAVQQVETLRNLEVLLRSHEVRVRHLAETEDGGEVWQHRRACVGDLAGMVGTQLARVSLLITYKEQFKKLQTAIYQGRSVDECEKDLWSLKTSLEDLAPNLDKLVIDRLRKDEQNLSDAINYVKKLNELMSWFDVIQENALSPTEVIDTSQLAKTRLSFQQNKDLLLSKCASALQSASDLAVDVSFYVEKFNDK